MNPEAEVLNTNVTDAVIGIPVVVDTIDLLPEEITIVAAWDVRPQVGTPDPAREEKKIAELAEMIKQEGQIQRALVLEVETGAGLEYHLIAGHRRRMAIYALNSTKGPNETLLKVKCDIIRGTFTDSQIRRKAMIENLHREDFSPMQLAADIRQIRIDNGWEGGKGTKHVAKYLGVSTATITQHEKYLDLPEDIQAQLDSRMISGQSALDLVDVKPEKLGEVMKLAAEKAQAAKAQRIAAQVQANANGANVDSTGTDVNTALGAETPSDTPAPLVPGDIKRGDVLAAARETPDALAVVKARTRKEILDFFESLDAPVYGHENGAVRIFARFLLDKYVTGEASDRQMSNKFDKMVEKADQGTEKKAVGKPAAAAKKAPKDKE